MALIALTLLLLFCIPGAFPRKSNAYGKSLALYFRRCLAAGTAHESGEIIPILAVPSAVQDKATKINYRKVPNIRHTKSQNLNASCLIL